jgi:hypothetical protein
MFKRRRFDVFHDQYYDKDPPPTFYVVLPAASDSYEIAELKIKALGLSAGPDGFLNRNIPYVGRTAQFGSIGNYTKEEIRLFLMAIGFRSYDYNSAIVHHPLSDNYFKIPSYDELMRQIKFKVDFRLWKEGIFGRP